jgi:hypothetical protein
MLNDLKTPESAFISFSRRAEIFDLSPLKSADDGQNLWNDTNISARWDTPH